MSDDGGYKEWQMQQTIDALTAVAEQLREHHKLAVEQWTLEAQRVKELEDNVHELRAENEALNERLNKIAASVNSLPTLKVAVEGVLFVPAGRYNALIDLLRGEGEK